MWAIIDASTTTPEAKQLASGIARQLQELRVLLRERNDTTGGEP